MRVEVDQSGKVEKSQQVTVLAFSNGTHYSVLVSVQTKRIVLEELARRRPERTRTNHHLLFFTTLLFLLLADHLSRISTLIIDVEYHGHDGRIKEHLLNLCRRHHIPFDPQSISFHRVGKKSPAHDLAIAVFRGERKPHRELYPEEILREIVPKKGK